MRTLVFDISLLAASKAPNFGELAEVDLKSSTKAVGAKASALDPARTWRVESARGLALIDAGHITQGWLQLADNAVKYSTPASPIVEAAQMSQTGTDRWLNLSVRDSGPGIPPEGQTRIFKRFSRLESSTGAEGTGLGLSIVSAIAEAHGGSVLLSGASGEGSTFTIRIPLVTEAQPSQADEEKR
jgi:two-component system, OmpR family, sensor kinase